MTPLVPALEYDFVVDDHITNHALASLGEGFLAVPEAIVRDDVRVEFASKGENEVVGIRAGGRLSNHAVIDQLLELGNPVDLMAQRRVDQHHGLEPLRPQLFRDQTDVGELRDLALTRMGDVRAIDDYRAGL